MKKARKHFMNGILKGVRKMRLDDHLLAGLFIGITIGLHYGASLVTFLPIFMVLGIVYLLRYVKG